MDYELWIYFLTFAFDFARSNRIKRFKRYVTRKD